MSRMQSQASAVFISIVASVRSGHVINVEEPDHEEPSIFDEVATNTKHLPNYRVDI